MAKARIGDILEIPTSVGFAYAQYTHQHPQMGGLIRVFDSVFRSRPENLCTLALGKVRFSAFFPVSSAVRKGIFKIVCNAEISPENQLLPVFRSPGGVEKGTWRVLDWWFWDGTKSWRVPVLSADDRNMPMKSILNDTMLVHRIESGWTPATDPR